MNLLLLLLLLLVLVAHHSIVVLVEKSEGAVDFLFEIRLHVPQSHHHHELVERNPTAPVQVNLSGFVFVFVFCNGRRKSPREKVKERTEGGSVAFRGRISGLVNGPKISRRCTQITLLIDTLRGQQ